MKGGSWARPPPPLRPAGRVFLLTLGLIRSTCGQDAEPGPPRYLPSVWRDSWKCGRVACALSKGSAPGRGGGGQPAETGSHFSLNPRGLLLGRKFESSCCSSNDSWQSRLPHSSTEMTAFCQTSRFLTQSGKIMMKMLKTIQHFNN